MIHVLVAGQYDFLYAGNIKFFKEPQDFVLMNYQYTLDTHQRKTLRLDSITCLRNTDHIPGPRSVYQFLQSVRPVALVLVKGDLLLDEKKKYCTASGIQLVEAPLVTMDGKTALFTYNFTQQIEFKATTA